MNVRILHCKRALRTALLILLLGVAGMSNVLAYDFEADNLLYTIASTDPIVFADYNVKTVCVANWDTDGDGELSYAEAAAVTSLGTVFSNNTAITSFDELQYFTGLTSIGGYAFRNCTGLTSVEIPNSVTSIGGAAFYGCTGLTSLEIPNSVTSIGGGAFYGCTGLTSVEIGNSVTSIGDSAFRGCTGLNSIEIPNSVTSIGRYAFYGCTGLTSVEIPNSVTSIGSEAFRGCTGLTSVEIPNSVTSIGGWAFYGCSGLEQIVVDTGNTVYDSRNNCDAIIETATNTLIAGCKNTVIPNSVTSIGDLAFDGCTGLTSVEIPNSVTSIGVSAFYGCTGLTSVEIPNSVTSIREWVFYGCTGLTSMTVHAEIPPTLGGDVFDGNMGIPVYVPCGSMEAYQNAEGWSAFTNYQCLDNTNILFADQNVKAICVANWDTNGDGELSYAEAAAVTSLGEVFRDNDQITSFNELQYFTGLTSIGSYAFYDCYSLTSVEIPNSVTSIGSEAFSYCTGLTSVEIPNSVTSIGSVAFSYCTGLTSVEIPNSVTSIGGAAFWYCTGLTSVEIPNSVTSIGEAAFSSCSGLEQIVVDTGNTVYDSRNNCDAIIETATNTLIAGCKNTLIPNTVTSIGNYAFVGCYSLTSVVIPNSVTSIGERAFSGCSGLTSVEIPNSVTSIGALAFYGCTGLTSMTVHAEIPPTLGGDVFNGVNMGIPVFVPCGFEEAYTSISWGGFSNIHGMCDGTVTATANPAEGGTISGTGPYEGGATCTLMATPNEGYAFINWTENGSVVSTEVEYNFTVAGDRELVANFVSTDPIVFADDNVKAICVANWDTNGDGELSYAEAAVVTDLGFVFQYNDQITSFDELQYFTGLTSIGDWAFFYCTGLTSVEIPNSVTSIGRYAFCYCTGLTSVEIPNSVTSIGSYEFSYCTGLTSVEIPNSVTTIENNAFEGCSGLEQIVVDTGNTVYDSRNNCDAIIETATNTLIAGCKNTLIPNTVTSIGRYAFCYCTGLTSVEIPNSVTSIGDWAFGGCTSLTSVEIPNSVTTIGSGAFCYCTGLTSIEIPSSVTSIGDYAFSDCYDLTSIKVNALIPPAIGDEVFYSSTCPIYVPYESLQAYLSEWSQYEDRILPFLQRSVAGYGESANGQWAFIASPLADNMEATDIENMTADDYDLYSFNQSEELEWRNHKYESFELVNGTGYLYANTDDVELVFKGTFNEDETKETDLVYDAAADFAGWNLVGNPFPYAATVDRSHYVMNAEGTALEPTALSEGTSIAPCTGVMVKADTEGETVTFAKAMRQGTANNGLLRIAVPDGDKAIVSFNVGDRLEKFGFGNQKATISIPQGGKDYAIAYSEGKGETPLNFKAAKNGEYTLTVDMENVDLAYLHLIDNLTGADVDLLVSPEYTFTAKTTDYASRFRLLFSGDDTTSTEGDSFAFIDAAGNIVVDGAEAGSTMQIVDVTGRVVRVCTDVARNVSTSGMTTGVYVLRLINGNDVMTQKLVIE